MRHFLTLFRMEVLSWVTLFMSFSQMVAIWLTYVLVNQAFYCIKKFCNPCEIVKIPKVGVQIAAVIGGCIAFHVPYIPYVQILLNTIDSYFNPCQLPIVSQWDIFIAERREPVSNLYYVLYFCLLYFVLFFVLKCRCIFSAMIMESSTTIPVTKTRAKSVIRFRV